GRGHRIQGGGDIRGLGAARLPGHTRRPGVEGARGRGGAGGADGGSPGSLRDKDRPAARRRRQRGPREPRDLPAGQGPRTARHRRTGTPRTI
ncbi:MAG: hypothetical protein AVDCRST_MAG01-01-3932, partial [uncultured Rubrobacteraceae bacterium]